MVQMFDANVAQFEIVSAYVQVCVTHISRTFHDSFPNMVHVCLTQKFESMQYNYIPKSTTLWAQRRLSHVFLQGNYSPGLRRALESINNECFCCICSGSENQETKSLPTCPKMEQILNEKQYRNHHKVLHIFRKKMLEPWKRRFYLGETQFFTNWTCRF